MPRTYIGSWRLALLGDFMRCLVASITCTGNGRTAQLVGRQYRGHSKGCIIILEAVASQICGFGTSSLAWQDLIMISMCCNDLRFSQGCGRSTHGYNYEINSHQYPKGYYLEDGIYPSWFTFAKTISTPENEKQIAFSREHGGCRKDVERAFGVLQARWAFVRHPARILSLNTIVEDEREWANQLQGWEF
jgi:hypothetical protein